jgi:hypothetical protein
MPLFPQEILPEEVEDPRPEQPTTDKAEPSAKGEKRKRKKSKCEKKKKSEKNKLKHMVDDEAQPVTSEASHKVPSNEPDERCLKLTTTMRHRQVLICLSPVRRWCRRRLINRRRLRRIMMMKGVRKLLLRKIF